MGSAAEKHLDLSGLAYGRTPMVWDAKYGAWYLAKVIDACKDKVKVTFLGWDDNSEFDEWIPKLSDRLDYHTGGRGKWKPIRNSPGAFTRLTPLWDPKGIQLAKPLDPPRAPLKRPHARTTGAKPTPASSNKQSQQGGSKQMGSKRARPVAAASSKWTRMHSPDALPVPESASALWGSREMRQLLPDLFQRPSKRQRGAGAKEAEACAAQPLQQAAGDTAAQPPQQQQTSASSVPSSKAAGRATGKAAGKAVSKAAEKGAGIKRTASTVGEDAGATRAAESGSAAAGHAGAPCASQQPAQLEPLSRAKGSRSKISRHWHHEGAAAPAAPQPAPSTAAATSQVDEEFNQLADWEEAVQPSTPGRAMPPPALAGGEDGAEVGAAAGTPFRLSSGGGGGGAASGAAAGLPAAGPLLQDEPRAHSRASSGCGADVRPGKQQADSSALCCAEPSAGVLLETASAQPASAERALADSLAAQAAAEAAAAQPAAAVAVPPALAVAVVLSAAAASGQTASECLLVEQVPGQQLLEAGGAVFGLHAPAASLEEFASPLHQDVAGGIHGAGPAHQQGGPPMPHCGNADAGGSSGAHQNAAAAASGGAGSAVAHEEEGGDCPLLPAGLGEVPTSLAQLVDSLTFEDEPSEDGALEQLLLPANAWRAAAAQPMEWQAQPAVSAGQHGADAPRAGQVDSSAPGQEQPAAVPGDCGGAEVCAPSPVPAPAQQLSTEGACGNQAHSEPQPQQQQLAAAAAMQQQGAARAAQPACRLGTLEIQVTLVPQDQAQQPLALLLEWRPRGAAGADSAGADLPAGSAGAAVPQSGAAAVDGTHAPTSGSADGVHALAACAGGTQRRKQKRPMCSAEQLLLPQEPTLSAPGNSKGSYQHGKRAKGRQQDAGSVASRPEVAPPAPEGQRQRRGRSAATAAVKAAVAADRVGISAAVAAPTAEQASDDPAWDVAVPRARRSGPVHHGPLPVAASPAGLSSDAARATASAAPAREAQAVAPPRLATAPQQAEAQAELQGLMEQALLSRALDALRDTAQGSNDRFTEALLLLLQLAEAVLPAGAAASSQQGAQALLLPLSQALATQARAAQASAVQSPQLQLLRQLLPHALQGCLQPGAHAAQLGLAGRPQPQRQPMVPHAQRVAASPGKLGAQQGLRPPQRQLRTVPRLMQPLQQQHQHQLRFMQPLQQQRPQPLQQQLRFMQPLQQQHQHPLQQQLRFMQPLQQQHQQPLQQQPRPQAGLWLGQDQALLTQPKAAGTPSALGALAALVAAAQPQAAQQARPQLAAPALPVPAGPPGVAAAHQDPIVGQLLAQLLAAAGNDTVL